MTDKRLDTELIHGGELRPRVLGAATLPIFQSTVFETENAANYGDILYPRLNTLPNQRVLGDKVARLEGSEQGLVTSSGMSSVCLALLSVLQPGDHVLMQRGVYGGTYTLARTELPRLGFEVEFFDPGAPESWQSLVRSNTRAIYVESISNPLIRVLDHASVLELARAHGLISIVDNTLASPVNFRAGNFGYDLVIHSATKYLNGHSDVIAGAICGGTVAMKRVRELAVHLGTSLDPHACFLLQRGMRTLALRVRQQNQTAVELAQHLSQHPSVRQVHYPSLPSHPDHGRSPGLMSGFGGVLSFELHGGAPAAESLLRRLELPVVGPSLGGVESLITRPATTSHFGMTPADRQQAGITDGLVRLAVGIEAAQDLIADLEQALA